MSEVSLPVLAEELLTQARDAPSGRASRTVRGHSNHKLRLTLIALRAGSELSDHESPGEATLQVLSGRVRMTNDDGTSWTGTSGALVDIPPVRHALAAEEDSTVLLTVALG